MMERRKLLQALVALVPSNIIMHGGQEAGRGYKIEPNAKYVVIVDPAVIDVEQFCTGCHAFPVDTPVFCCHEPRGIDNAIRIYKVED